MHPKSPTHWAKLHKVSQSPKMPCYVAASNNWSSNFKLEQLTSCHLHDKPTMQAKLFWSGTQLHASNKELIPLSAFCTLLLPKESFFYWHSLSILLMNCEELARCTEPAFSGPFQIKLSKDLFTDRISETCT